MWRSRDFKHRTKIQSGCETTQQNSCARTEHPLATSPRYPAHATLRLYDSHPCFVLPLHSHCLSVIVLLPSLSPPVLPLSPVQVGLAGLLCAHLGSHGVMLTDHSDVVLKVLAAV